MGQGGKARLGGVAEGVPGYLLNEKKYLPARGMLDIAVVGSYMHVSNGSLTQ